MPLLPRPSEARAVPPLARAPSSQLLPCETVVPISCLAPADTASGIQSERVAGWVARTARAVTPWCTRARLLGSGRRKSTPRPSSSCCGRPGAGAEKRPIIPAAVCGGRRFLSVSDRLRISLFYNFQERTEERHCGRPYYPALLAKVFHGRGAIPAVRRHPVADGGCWVDSELAEVVAGLVATVEEGGEVVYLHCYGGHGRAGVVASLVLVRLLGLGVAVDEAAILLHRPSPFSRRFNRDDEGVPVERQSRRRVGSGRPRR